MIVDPSMPIVITMPTTNTRLRDTPPVYVGDPIPGSPWWPHNPFQPVMPDVPYGPPDFWPLQPWSPSTPAIVVVTPKWRTKHVAASIEFSIDVPGMRSDDATLTVDSSNVSLRWRRADTDEGFSASTSMPAGFDPGTAMAELERGVLTVRLHALAASQPPRRVDITVR